jgi:hypothetical protein
VNGREIGFMNDYATTIVYLLAVVAATALVSGLAGLLMDRLHPRPQPFLLRHRRDVDRDETIARYLVDVGDSA